MTVGRLVLAINKYSMIQFWKVLKNIVLPKRRKPMGREGTEPCKLNETWKDNVLKKLFKSTKEKRKGGKKM